MSFASSAPARARKLRRNLARPNSRLERNLRSRGLEHIAGVDEVGRGSLFGPVVAAAVILEPGKPIHGLNDSKKLDRVTRETLCSRIHERALTVAVAAMASGQIDRWNIYQATRRAMRLAVLSLAPAPDFLLIDAMNIETKIPQRPVIGGDARSFSIAAASIVAKVTRDQWMEQWDSVFPAYGLASNKGYATPDHLRALERFGPTPLHRHSFAPVALCARFPATLPSESSLHELSVFTGFALDIERSV